MYTLDELKRDRDIWSGSKSIPTCCSWCKEEFEVKYGTLYNVIRRDAEGIYCGRKCAGAARAYSTQKKFRKEGGKDCKRCGEFKDLDEFSSLPNPPYFRAECKRCHNYKPARKYTSYKEKAIVSGVVFKLTLDQFESFWNQKCFYCNAKVSAPRLELVNPSDGYIARNIVSCCRRCQKFKSNMPHKKFVSLCCKICNNVKESEVIDE